MNFPSLQVLATWNKHKSNRFFFLILNVIPYSPSSFVYWCLFMDAVPSTYGTTLKKLNMFSTDFICSSALEWKNTCDLSFIHFFLFLMNISFSRRDLPYNKPKSLNKFI